MGLISKKYLVLLAIMVLAIVMSIPVNAGTTGIVSGVITDASTGAKLSGVNVVIKGTNLTTVTDADGYFVITNVPPGTYEVKATLVGYGDKLKSDIQVMMDTTSAANLTLTKVEKVEKDLVIKSTKSMLQPTMIPTLSIVQARQEKLSKGQPNYLYQTSGIISTQPGIVIDGDGNPHIRGGRNTEIGYMLEGIPVMEPLTNLFGTNNVTVGMSKMQIYSGGYRAEYGNAISGVLNEIKKTGSEAPGCRMELTGGGQGFKGTYFEYGAVSPSGLDYYIGSYLWQTEFERTLSTGCASADTIAKFVLPKGNDKWTLLLNQGSARYHLDTVHDVTYMNQPVKPEEDHTHQSYDLIGLTWSHNFNPSSFITIRPYRFTTRFELDALAPDSPIGCYYNYGTNQFGLQTEYTNQINSKHLMKTGVSFAKSQNRYLNWIPDLGIIFGYPAWGDYHFTSNVDTFQTGMFIQDQVDFGNKWHGEFGLRYDAMKFNKELYPDTTDSQISPRLGLSYKIDNSNVLKTSWGRFIQFPPSFVMESNYVNPLWEAYRVSNAELKPERSTSWDFSWERQLNTTTMMRITPYYRSYTDLLQARRAHPGDPASFAYTYVNSGRGKSTGVEFYLLKKTTKKWDGWLSYTWQKARANASSFTSAIDPNLWAYCDWDQRHTLTLVAAYKSKLWEHNWQLSYGSGLADISTDLSAAPYQKHSSGSAIVSWNIIRKLPENSTLGDSIALNIWNVFNVGKPLQHFVYPDGSREVASWTTPRFITLSVQRKF